MYGERKRDAFLGKLSQMYTLYIQTHTHSLNHFFQDLRSCNCIYPPFVDDAA